MRIGIDGLDGAGKTTLGDELVGPARASGRPVIRSGIDSFHRTRALRYRRGREHPESFYADSFDHDAVLAQLLRPLGPGGRLRYRPRAFDHVRDAYVHMPYRFADPRSILIFDGIFLQRPELAAAFDVLVFVEVSSEVRNERDAARAKLAGADMAVYERLERTRYRPSREIYLERCRPRSRADFVFDNTVLDNPVLRFRP